MKFQIKKSQNILLFVLSVCSYSSDCQSLADFGLGLGIRSQQPSIWSALQGDCCVADGITCVSQNVTEIDWSNKGLDGFVNGSAIPIGLTSLILFTNELTGTIPVILPNGLVVLSLQRNLLIGNIPSLLPSGLTYLSLYRNQLTGDLPYFPSTIQYLALGVPAILGVPASTYDNHFSGTLALYAPVMLYINDNWISDIIIQDSSGLSVCDFSNTPLLNNPNIVGLSICSQTGLYPVGSLSNTKSIIEAVSSSSISTLFVNPTQFPTSQTFTMSVSSPRSLLKYSFLAWSTASESKYYWHLSRSKNYSVSSIGTKNQGKPVQRIFVPFLITLPIVFHTLLDVMILAKIFMTTPFKREFKRKYMHSMKKELESKIEL